MNIQHTLLFPSVITLIECDNYHLVRDDLISWIYEYQKTDDGVTISNRGGWQSHSNFYHHPTFIKFYNYIFEHVNNNSIYDCQFNLGNMWINVNKKNHYNGLHDHPNCHISGVFWIKIPKNSGKISFQTPRCFERSRLLQTIPEKLKEKFFVSESWNISPQEGTILLFPSDLKHEVFPNQSDEDRISIAFNLNFQ